MPDLLFEEERERFMQYVAEQYGQTLFEQVSGELWMRCAPAVRKIMRRPPEHRPTTRKWEAMKLVGRIKRDENDFFNHGRRRPSGPRVVSFSDRVHLADQEKDARALQEEYGVNNDE